MSQIGEDGCSLRGMGTKSREKTFRVAIFSEMYGAPCADFFFFNSSYRARGSVVWALSKPVPGLHLSKALHALGLLKFPTGLPTYLLVYH